MARDVILGIPGSARDRWEKGVCPCCGAALDRYGDPVTVAEGVLVCGWCIERMHNDDDLLPRLLELLVTGADI